MKRLIINLLAMTLIVNSACDRPSPRRQSDFPAPPRAAQVEKELEVHGQVRMDPYYWLNQRENPEVIAYLTAENEYLNRVMENTAALQDTIYEEIVGRIKPDDTSVPYLDNGFYYYTRYVPGGEYPLYCRKKGSLEAEEEIILNVNELARGYAYYSVSGVQASPDNKLLAFGVDTVSRRKYEIRIKNLETGEILSDRIPETTGSVSWANDSRTFFFTRKDPVTLRSERIFRYRTSQPVSLEEQVYHESDETFSVDISRSKSGRYLFIRSYSTLSSEFRYLDADRPEAAAVVIHPREKDHLYEVEHLGDHFFIRTNRNAVNFRLMRATVSSPGINHWFEVIPHRSDVLLQDFELFTDFLVISERSKGLTKIRVIRFGTGQEHYIDFGEEVYHASVAINKVQDTNVLRYQYTSFTTPSSTYDYDMATLESKLLKRDEVVGGFAPEDYESRRLYATAADGTEVPVSLVYRKGLQLNGKNPMLLYAYGSYGSSMNATFSFERLSLLDRGFVYAIAHVRGGQEMGRSWYEEGKLLKKKNTFTDFIDVADYLISEGYTSSGFLCAKGGSAGGLLMGAILNMRPDLFRAVIANVPFVDVVTTMLDASIPLTTSEYDEWGNPNLEEYYDYMLSYSPYDQVKAVEYPAILVTTGLHDSQVQYFEPAKWVAKLRDQKKGDRILLLKTDMESGHGGASGRFKRFRDTALEYAFLLDQVGLFSDPGK
ncbi:MAG: S9 family peptidase [Bacteroidales bacterium]